MILPPGPNQDEVWKLIASMRVSLETLETENSHVKQKYKVAMVWVGVLSFCTIILGGISLYSALL